MPNEARWSELFAGRNAARATMLASAVVLHAINVFLATTILPSIVADIGGLDYYAWNTTLFVVASIIGAACSARLLQSAGPRGAYLVAALLFLAGATACALAGSMPVMLAGRTVQGLGGGLLVALSYAMIRLIFPENLWPRAIALVSGMWGIGTLFGPAVGGIFAELGMWRVAYGSLVPVAALFAVAALALLPARSHDTDERSALPIPQLLFLSASVLAVSAGSVSEGLLATTLGIAAAVALFGLLILAEARSANRLFPKGAFNLATPLGRAYATVALFAMSVTCSDIFIPLFLQVLHGQSPLFAGYIAAVMSAGWTAGSIFSSSLRDGGITTVGRVAPWLCIGSLAALALLMPAASDGAWPQVLQISIAVTGVGLAVGLVWPHLLTRVFQVAPQGEQDLAAASVMTVQMYATAMGASLAGMIANTAGLTNPGGVEGTANAAFWLFATLIVGPVLCLFLMGKVLKAPTAAMRSGAAE